MGVYYRYMETPIAPPPVVPTPAPMTAPPMTPSTPASSKRWLRISLIAVVVLAGAAYGWMKLNPATPVAELTRTPSASVTATPDPTAGWKTYTNTQYGFEVKYPADWKEIVGTASQATLSKVSLVKPAGPSEEFPDTLDISVLSLTVERLFSEAHPSYRNIESVQFAGISAQKFNNAPLEPMGRADHTLIAVPRNGSLILLDYQTDADVDQILSTFKFTRTP